MDPSVVAKFTESGNGKSDSLREEPETKAKTNYAAIRRQLEYYFGQKNYKKDHFL